MYEVTIVHGRIRRQGTEVIFMWVPAHVGTVGSDRVDRIAKQTMKKEVMDTNNKLLKSEGNGIVWREINKACQQH